MLNFDKLCRLRRANRTGREVGKGRRGVQTYRARSIRGFSPTLFWFSVIENMCRSSAETRVTNDETEMDRRRHKRTNVPPILRAQILRGHLGRTSGERPSTRSRETEEGSPANCVNERVTLVGSKL